MRAQWIALAWWYVVCFGVAGAFSVVAARTPVRDRRHSYDVDVDGRHDGQGLI